jgi:hypothetical protein
MPTYTAVSSSGVATINVAPQQEALQFTVESAVDSNLASANTGSAGVEVRAPGSDYYETVYDNNGEALALDLTKVAQTHVLDGIYNSIKISSSVSGDSFTVVVQ